MLQKTSLPLRKWVLPLILLPILVMGCQLSVTPGPTPYPTALPLPTLAPAVSPIPVAFPAATSNEEAALVNLYQRVNPGVVNITDYQQQNGQTTPLAQGSGFVYDADGHIVTNAHVVQGVDRVDVTFSNGIVRRAVIVGIDLNSDLAVIKVDSLPAGVSPLVLGNIDQVMVGQTVVAIGNPFGLDGTLTKGIVSALGRSIPALTTFTIPQAIQTDAAINPGNSGGPLLNLNGEVIGVNAQIETGGTSTSNSGVGFAIPVSIVQRVVPALIQDGKYEWAWLGVRGGNLFPEIVQAMNLTVEQGAYVHEITPNSPADIAGLRGSSSQATVDGIRVSTGGDVIIAVDGQPVRTFDELLIYMTVHTGPGQEIRLTILRDGNTQEITVKLGTRPNST